MGSGDFRINSHVRQILVRHWIETDSVSATAINGVLYMRGYIQYRAAKRTQVGAVTADFLEKLERELKSLKELKKIRWQLDNWERDEQGWLRAGETGSGQSVEDKTQAAKKDDGPSPLVDRSKPF